MKENTISKIALEKAAKYICTYHCGKCPLVVENFPCPGQCTLETIAWHCWVAYFQEKGPGTGEQ